MFKRAIVIFPQFSHIELIQRLRQAYDPLAAVLPPHLTLVFPFESDISPEHLLLHLNSVMHRFAPFQISMRGITGQSNEYLFLNVKRGNDQLIALHDQLYTGILAPYLILHETYVPHLTVGRLQDETRFAEALKQAQSVTASFETELQEVVAYRIEPDQKREVECRVNFSHEWLQHPSS
jgi:2'-5' RNA ligase